MLLEVFFSHKHNIIGHEKSLKTHNETQLPHKANALKKKTSELSGNARQTKSYCLFNPHRDNKKLVNIQANFYLTYSLSIKLAYEINQAVS
jgi:hypothetical protein